MKRYREWDPRQSLLLPPSLLDWLPEEHAVYFLLDVVDQLDLSAIEDVLQAKDHRGTRPFAPRMMVGLLLYGYCAGVFSSRKLERATYENVGFRVLSGGAHPDHSAICSFRKRFAEALSGLFLQVLRLCQEAGLVKLGHVALDGTKVAANASKHKANSYDRMTQRERELQAEIAALMEQAERVDASEDAEYGQGKRGDELPEELRRREERLKKIKAAKEALEAEAARAHAEHQQKLAEEAEKAALQADQASAKGAESKAARAKERASECAANALAKAEARLERSAAEAEQLAASAKTHSERCQAARAEKAREAAQRELERAKRLCRGEATTDSSSTLPEHHVPFDRHGDPSHSAQRNFTDPDSKIMKSGGGYIQGYNCQAAVDAEHQIIVALAATNQAPDQEHLPRMLDAVIENCGKPPDAFSADAGYWSESNAIHCQDANCDAYIATGRQPHGRRPEPDGNASGLLDANAQRSAMREKLRTREGKSTYARRKAIVEPVFGQIKEAQGLRRFLLRGLDMVRCEWSLACTGHNLLKLFRARRVAGFAAMG
jgi:transposase